MALAAGEWGTLIGVLVLILSMFGYNHFAGLRAAPAGKSAKGDDDHSVNPMLSRFVVHDGDVIGEVMAVDGDQLIVKHKGKYQAFPAGEAALKDDEVHLLGTHDMTAASTAGASWHAANSKGQDDEITAHLTTSADIKKPAREAFEERTSDEEE